MDNIGKNALKAGTWYTVCTFIIKGIAFLTMPLFNRLMSLSEVGLYANFTSWITILSGVITLDLFSSVNLAHFEYKDKISEYMSTITICGTIYTLFIYGVANFFRDQIISLLDINEYMFHVMFAYFLVNPAITILHAKFRIYLQYKQTIITSLIPTACSVLIALLCVFLISDNRLEARVLGYYGAWILFAVAIYAYIVFRGRKVKLEYIKFALPISIPLIIHTLSNTILSTSDRIMIKKLCGAEDTAFYAVAYGCAMIVSILWTAINQAWAPWCFEMIHRGEERGIGKVAKPILLLFSALVIAFVLIAPEVLLLMGGREYVQAADVIPPVMVGLIAQMLYTLYVNIEYYYKKQKQIMLGTILAAILNIVLNFIFIPIFGYVAAAYTTLAGYLFLMLIHYIFVRRMKKSYIYDMRFNIALVLSALAIGILTTFLYDYLIIRWAIIGVAGCCVCVVVIRNWKELRMAISEKDFVKILKVLHFA